MSATVAVGPSRKARRRRRIERRIAFEISRIAFLVIVLFFTLTPVVWIVLTSFKPQGEWVNDPPVWIPSDWSTLSFSRMWETGGKEAFLNSVIVVSISTLLAVGIGSLAAYSFSRFRTGGPHVVNWILSIKFLPPVVFAVPLLIMFTNLRIYDSYLGLILLYATFNTPFVVWMMKGFFDEVPSEIEESARVDGCSWLGTFFRISLPLVMPGFVSTVLLTFIFGWSEFLFALVFTSQERYTIPVELASYFSEAVGLEWGPQAALSVVGILPIIVFSFLIQRYLIRGMTFGAVKQ